MNDTELDRCAGSGNKLRPDWPVPSLRTFLAKHFADRAYADVAVALAYIATLPNPTDTPKLLLEDGPWWRATASRLSPAERHPSSTRLGDLCDVHGVHRDNCGCGGRPMPQTWQAKYAQDHQAAVNAAGIAKVRAELQRAGGHTEEDT